MYFVQVQCEQHVLLYILVMKENWAIFILFCKYFSYSWIKINHLKLNSEAFL